MFSSRVPHELTPNRLARAVAAHRASGRRLLDLTVSNPTIVGIQYPDGILAPLGSAASSTYRPEPFGLPRARQAVAQDYARRGTSVAAEQVVLTSSTSEAYSLLFKLLCDPGEVALVPAPSYPLFDHLSRLDGVQAERYRLDYHGRWMVDEHSVDSSWTNGVRAVLAVSPNNPTGSLLSAADLHLLSARCAERDAALIIDEVFIDYPLGPADLGTHGPEDLRTDGPLTFRLGGLSKSAGLPQVKLGWLVVGGPDEIVGEALQRLEIICDTYLSVSTPVQVAAPLLIESGAAVRAEILDRIRRNYSALSDTVTRHPSTELLHAEGGWSAVVRIPSTRHEEQVVLDLLERDDVLVHPGYFFDLPHEAFLVLSLLPSIAEFDEGIHRVMKRVHG